MSENPSGDQAAHTPASANAAGRDTAGQFAKGASGNPGGKPKREYSPPSVEVVIRTWAALPSQSYQHRSIRDPDGLEHDFPQWCRHRVETTLQAMQRSGLVTWKQRRVIEEWAKAFYRDGSQKPCVLGYRTFHVRLEASITAKRYYARPKERTWIPEDGKPKPSKRLPLKRGAA